MFSAGPFRVEIIRFFPDRRLRAARSLRYRENPNHLPVLQFPQPHLSSVLEDKNVASPPVIRFERGRRFLLRTKNVVEFLPELEKLTDSSRGVGDVQPLSQISISLRAPPE